MPTHQKREHKAKRQVRNGFHEMFRQVRARVYERHGFLLTEEQYRFLSQQITDGQAQFVAQQTPQRSVWRVSFEAGEIIAVYHRGSSLISTVLEPPMLERLLRGPDGG